jgi:branched-chain amino acid transport system permease protein
MILINRLRDSRLGRAWMAMREDELAAASMGINIVQTKLLAFSMGAFFSGFGGAFFAAFVSGAFPSSFDFSVSVIVLCMVILGGLGNVTGVIVGGLVIELSDRLFLPQVSLFLQDLAKANPTLEWLQRFDPNLYRFGLFGLVLVMMMQLRPEGLLPNARRRAELHEGDENAEQVQPVVG